MYGHRKHLAHRRADSSDVPARHRVRHRQSRHDVVVHQPRIRLVAAFLGRCRQPEIAAPFEVIPVGSVVREQLRERRCRFGEVLATSGAPDRRAQPRPARCSAGGPASQRWSVRDRRPRTACRGSTGTAPVDVGHAVAAHPVDRRLVRRARWPAPGPEYRPAAATRRRSARRAQRSAPALRAAARRTETPSSTTVRVLIVGTVVRRQPRLNSSIGWADVCYIGAGRLNAFRFCTLGIRQSCGFCPEAAAILVRFRLPRGRRFPFRRRRRSASFRSCATSACW